MFLIGPDRYRCIRSVARMRSSLECLSCGPIVEVTEGELTLVWFSCKPSDNLHIYSDGYIIGKTSFEEPISTDAYHHAHPMPAQLHPLLQSTRIRKCGGTLTVEPNHITPIFYSGNTASDMQLLLADLHGYLPDDMRVATLCCVGYFPGNLTLFHEIQKIPFLADYNLHRQHLRRIGSYDYHAPDDEEMVRTLIDNTPGNMPSYLGISGGYDSRFVLAILLHSSKRPRLVHIEDGEDEIVRALASRLDLEVEFCTADVPGLPAELYTLMTDAQIYFKGGQYSKLRNHLPMNSLYYTGLFADPILKNAWRTAWKAPALHRGLFERIVDHALLSTTPDTLARMQADISRSELKSFLMQQLSYIREYYPFKRSKEWASWFYYMNRGIRWSHATVADLSFFTYPVMLLSELKSLSYGISCHAWDNFNKDRVRRLNRSLLPDLDVPYFDGQPVEYQPGIAHCVRKVKREYWDRLLLRQRNLKTYRQRSQKPASSPGLTIPENPEIERYCTAPVTQILQESGCTISQKRAVITLCHVIEWLRPSAAVPAGR